jgi:hypothetical protein
MNHHRIVSPERAKQWLKCMYLTIESGRMCRPKPWRRATGRPKIQQLELLVTK